MDERSRELLLLVVVAVILGLTVSYTRSIIEYAFAILFCAIIILTNSIVKHIVAYHYELDITIKPWTLYQYGFRKSSHFKEKIPMIWLPLLLSLLSQGRFWWMGVLEFDARARPERAARRHSSRHRYTAVTEEHQGTIAAAALFANILLALISAAIGFSFFAQLNALYALWSVIPLARLDGSKILFANKALWLVCTLASIITVVITYQ